MTYYVPKGGLPPQTALTTDRARFTEAYAVIPARTLSDITASYLPGWERHADVGAGPAAVRLRRDVQPVRRRGRRPAAAPTHPEGDPAAEAVLFVVDGTLALTVDGAEHALEPGGYAFLPPGTHWTLRNTGSATAAFHWIRKAYHRVEGLDVPPAFVTQ